MLLKICYRLGGVLLIAGLLLPLWHFGLAAHVLAAGALLFGVPRWQNRATTPYSPCAACAVSKCSVH